MPIGAAANLHHLPGTSELLSQILAPFFHFPFISVFSSQLLPTRVDSLHLSCTCPISSQPNRSDSVANFLVQLLWAPDSQMTFVQCATELLKHAACCCCCCCCSCLHKVHPSTTSYYKACTKHFLVLLRTTKLAQSTSRYYFVLQSLHKVRPSTTSYYKACTKYFPVLLRTAKLAQSTSQYYFVLQSLHKVLPSTTSYCKACTTYFPVLLRTAKLAQSTSQYYFVLQSSKGILKGKSSMPK